jgi:uncharacterized protein
MSERKSNAMRITVFGAGGSVGSCVVAEALSRGHEVVAVVRNPKRAARLPKAATVRAGDARHLEDVVALSRGQDFVVSATRPPPGSERELVAAAKTLLAGLAQTGVRLLLVGGAASLTVGANGATVVDDPKFPAAFRDLALACVSQLEVCRADDRANWTYLSPPALLEPGERTGKYRLGRDELLVDATGNSTISVEDFAVALLDEAERPKHPRMRFTVAY